ncbi:hypothetical protein [Brucella intermedia]|uniref:hypothetical protein n=1 Tax=Brucella intermedia TaxID=94625 RepID=UPI00159291D8|nr:hypothetical protein [Brucella intermedia]
MKKTASPTGRLEAALEMQHLSPRAPEIEKLRSETATDRANKTVGIDYNWLERRVLRWTDSCSK